MTNNKETLRKALLSKRRAIPQDEREAAEQAAYRQLFAHPLFLSSQKIACYFSENHEFDCIPIIKTIWQQKKECFLPVLSLQEKALHFAAYHNHDRLRLNRYGILEPETKEILDLNHLDLVFLPLVGFDLKGNRLGMGGGYYDRTFQSLQKKEIKKPFLLGLGFQVQKITQLPQDSWDVKLDGVLTEERLYLF